MAGAPVILDLGCGGQKAPGSIGVDVVPLPGVDLVHDLTKVPYPLPDDWADEVRLSHVLEHFADPLPILEEVWRIARPGAIVTHSHAALFGRVCVEGSDAPAGICA